MGSLVKKIHRERQRTVLPAGLDAGEDGRKKEINEKSRGFATALGEREIVCSFSMLLNGNQIVFSSSDSQLFSVLQSNHPVGLRVNVCKVIVVAVFPLA